MLQKVCAPLTADRQSLAFYESAAKDWNRKKKKKVYKPLCAARKTKTTCRCISTLKHGGRSVMLWFWLCTQDSFQHLSDFHSNAAILHFFGICGVIICKSSRNVNACAGCWEFASFGPPSHFHLSHVNRSEKMGDLINSHQKMQHTGWHSSRKESRAEIVGSDLEPLTERRGEALVHSFLFIRLIWGKPKMSRIFPLVKTQTSPTLSS